LSLASCQATDLLQPSQPHATYTPINYPLLSPLLLLRTALSCHGHAVGAAAGLRFRQNGVLLPPDWDMQQAAQRLMDVANKLYAGTAIQ
jgi:hypothetical protein